jgi:alpha-L-fucosidase
MNNNRKKITKKIYVVAIITAISGLASAETGITITETRLDSGDSTIKVVNSVRGITKTYNINMSRHHYPATSSDDPLVKKYKSWKFGAFMHFNCNTFSGTEYCSSKDPVKDFDPTALDVRQWVKTLKAAGMNYAVLTVRHTGEFLLWDSATSEIKVTNSSYEKDLVKEYVDQCRKAGIAPGIYYCLWGDGWRPNPNARAIILAQLHELATNYGDIAYFWLDMPHCVGWLAKDLSQQELYDSLKNINSNTIVMFNNTIQDGSVIKAFPTDVINGEMCSPPKEGHNPWRTIEDKEYYIPFEYEPCSQQRGTHVYGSWDFPGASWFTYGSGKEFDTSKPLPADFLYRRIRTAYDRGASNVLMSFAPDHTGLYRKGDIEQAVKLGRMIKDPSLAPELVTLGCKATASAVWENDNNWGGDNAFDDNLTTRWAGARDTRSGWLEIDLGQAKRFSKVMISEGWDRVRKFELQVKKDNRWQAIHKGTTIGADYRASFEPVTARHVRLNILEAIEAPTIWEVQLFIIRDEV